MGKEINTIWDGELTDIEQHPKMQEFAIRQRRALSYFMATQAQEYLMFAFDLKDRLADEADESVHSEPTGPDREEPPQT